jgi:hypothetical protein
MEETKCDIYHTYPLNILYYRKNINIDSETCEAWGSMGRYRDAYLLGLKISNSHPFTKYVASFARRNRLF